MKSQIVSCVTGLAAVLFVVPAGHAITYDAASDFSIVSNPNGVWSYGYSSTLGGELILYPDKGINSGLEYWQKNISLGAPSVAYNPTSITLDFGTPVYAPKQVGSHPGPNNQISVIRFIAPVTGAYHIEASFVGIDEWGTTTDVHVLVNDVSIFNGSVNGYGPASGTSTQFDLELNVNDRVDFAVGFGNGSFYNDSTGVDAQLSLSPCGTALYPFPLGDLTQDCYVNLPDLAEMAVMWQTSWCDAGNLWCGGADLSQSGDVGVEDLAMLAGAWLTCTDPFPPCLFVP